MDKNARMRSTTHPIRTMAVAALTVAALLLAACGSDGGDGATGTTIAPADNATAYTERGPYPVGVTTLQLDKGPSVEVWYPAVEGTTGTDEYDLRDYLPEAISALIPDDAPPDLATFTYDASRDADAADGTFPLVLFSHGSTAVRVQSSELTSHLASWGMVVASPDHPSRNLRNVLSGTAATDRAAGAADAVDDLRQTLSLMADQNDAGPLEGRIDLDQVAAVGHSAGGGTVLAIAADPEIDGYVSMASGALGGDGTLPAKPSFFIAGTEDRIVEAEERTRPAFDAAPAPSLLWILEGVGHNGFDDFCTFGNGSGIIGVAQAAGLGPVLDAQPGIKRLGEDGCLAPAVPVTDTFPIIDHAVTSWLRNLFGIDAEPVGLGPAVAGAYVVPVEIVVKD
jgi:dienelactone hydrolase